MNTLLLAAWYHTFGSGILTVLEWIAAIFLIGLGIWGLVLLWRVRVRRVSRWKLALLGLVFFYLAKEIIIMILIAKWIHHPVGRIVDYSLDTVLAILWATGWVGNYVAPGKEGVVTLFGKVVTQITVDNGENWLPPGCEVTDIQEANIKWRTLEIPLTAQEGGFQVTTSDLAILLTRAVVPWRIIDATALDLEFTESDIIALLRSTMTEVIKALAGQKTSKELQRNSMADEFRNALRPRLELLVANYPIEIKFELVSVSKFIPLPDVIAAQQRAVIEIGQKAGEVIQDEHILELIRRRFVAYATDDKFANKADAFEAARRDVNLALEKAQMIIVDGGGKATDSAVLAELIRLLQPKPTTT